MRTIKSWPLIFSMAIAGCGEEGNTTQAQKSADIRIMPVGYEFRGIAYSSFPELERVLEANPDVILTISAIDCSNPERVAEIVAFLQNRGQISVAFSTLSGGCQ